MTIPISAGVYPREIDKSVVVPAVAGSIAAIIINSPKGPSNVVTTITNNKEFVDTFGAPEPDLPAMYAALAFLERGSNLKVVRVVGAGAVASSATFVDSGSNQSLIFEARGEGVWGDDIDVKISLIDDVAETMTVEVLESATAVVLETFVISKNVTKKDGFGRSQFAEDVINGVSAYVTVTDVPANGYPDDSGTPVEGPYVQKALTGGSDGAAVGSSEINVGWDLFAVKEEVEVSMLIQGGWDLVPVQTKMIGVAENRQDCIALLDIPYAVTQSATAVDDMVTFANTTLNQDTSWAALYGGWVTAYDQYNDKNIDMPPSGFVAGAIARTADVAEIWYAPAGAVRGRLNALGVTNVFTEGHRDTLYTARINPIQSFVGEGIQIFGQKTLQSIPSALDRVNVRMLMITIMKAMTLALRPFVFDFNDTFTRENIGSILNQYMTDIKSRRGVTDFLVVADDSNNTAQIIDNNQMIVDVYVKPTRAAEFIRLNGIISATGASFTVQT